MSFNVDNDWELRKGKRIPKRGRSTGGRKCGIDAMW